MAKKRTDQAAKEPATPKKPNRTGVPLHAWIEEEIAGALDDYVNGTEPRVSKTAAIETALKDFLRKNGHWPRKGAE